MPARKWSNRPRGKKPKEGFGPKPDKKTIKKEYKKPGEPRKFEFIVVALHLEEQEELDARECRLRVASAIRQGASVASVGHVQCKPRTLVFRVDEVDGKYARPLLVCKSVRSKDTGKWFFKRLDPPWQV